MKVVVRILSSLRLAVILLIGITASLAAGTFLESFYDTRTARYWVYDAIWFHALLALLGLLILTVALTRVPWKKRHIPFLLAHLGIILLLVGSWVTKRSVPPVATTPTTAAWAPCLRSWACVPGSSRWRWVRRPSTTA